MRAPFYSRLNVQRKCNRRKTLKNHVLDVSDNLIVIAFNTGEVAMVSATENVSLPFKLTSGESYVYNRETSLWQEALKFFVKRRLIKFPFQACVKFEEADIS